MPQEIPREEPKSQEYIDELKGLLLFLQGEAGKVSIHGMPKELRHSKNLLNT